MKEADRRNPGQAGYGWRGVPATCESPRSTLVRMADEKLWTAAELEALAPEERGRLFAERVVTDLSQVSPEFLARVQAKGRALLEEHGVVARQTDGG